MRGSVQCAVYYLHRQLVCAAYALSTVMPLTPPFTSPSTTSQNHSYQWLVYSLARRRQKTRRITEGKFSLLSDVIWAVLGFI